MFVNLLTNSNREYFKIQIENLQVIRLSIFKPFKTKYKKDSLNLNAFKLKPLKFKFI